MSRLPAMAVDEVRARMDRIYRPQRHIYDLTRKYYLLGRDRLLSEMAVRPGETVLEVGCGTGRNLARLAALYPGARLIGVEPSAAMLETARSAAARSGGAVRLLQGTAEDLDLAMPGLADGAHHILFSYVLSMVVDPARAIDRALGVGLPGAVLHVVDFGDMKGLPRPAAAALRAWLRWFHVIPRPDAARHLAAIEAEGRGRHTAARIGGGYAELLRLRLS
jgi:S-adenosylmethionine-diacylgycerolhomoserine-N-methlytransferase